MLKALECSRNDLLILVQVKLCFLLQKVVVIVVIIIIIIVSIIIIIDVILFLSLML